MTEKQLLSVNGAEWLDVEAQARDAGLSMPQWFRSKCGLTARGIVVAGGGAAREEVTRARRPSRAMERRSITVPLTGDEREQLLAEARQAGTRLAQYIRSRAGFQIRNTSLPGTDERGNEEDDAWERLKRLGHNPQEYFPPDV